jgi:hypothetical protein
MNFHLIYRNLTCFILILSSISCFSQDTHSNDDIKTTNISKINFIDPGFSYEFSISRFSSIYTQAFLFTSAKYNSNFSGNDKLKFYFDPALAVQYRYYYNGIKRLNKGKRTELNSMNYISPVLELVFSKRSIDNSDLDEKDRRPIYLPGITWGLQRNYKSRFSLDLNLGFGYVISTTTFSTSTGQSITNEVSQLSFLGFINLGIWLNKRK